MSKKFLTLFCLFALIAIHPKASADVEIPLADGSVLDAVIREAEAGKPMLLMFHQGGSNVRGEYVSIWPRLDAEGFGYVAVDLRSGGQLYGNYNRTIAARSGLVPLCETFEGVEAGLAYVKSNWPNTPVIAWGSSFTAAHAITLASKNPDDIERVVAFSPSSGGPMSGCKADALLAGLTVPLLLVRPQAELEVPSAQAQFQLAIDAGHSTHVASPGHHGASALDESRVGDSVEETWNTVLKFLDQEP